VIAPSSTSPNALSSQKLRTEAPPVTRQPHPLSSLLAALLAFLPAPPPALEPALPPLVGS
jgi:hypothetical protein